MSHLVRSRRGAWLFFSPLAIALVTFACFSPAIRNGFVDWDDTANVVRNAEIRGLGFANLRWMFGATLGGHWHPLTWLSFAVDHALWGLNPAGFHLTNVLLHTGTAVAVWYALVVLLARLPSPPPPDAARLGALVATLLWALHPLRVESVAWVTERRDVLSGLFWVLAVAAYLRAQDTATVSASRRRRVLASLGCLVLSLLAKSWGMSFVAVLLVLDTWPLRRWISERGDGVLVEKLPFLFVGLAGMALAWRAVHPFVHDFSRHGPGERLGQAAFGASFYLWKTLWPVGLVPLVEFRGRIDPLAWPWIAYVLGAMVMTAVLVALRRRWPAGLAAWCAYGAILAPVLGLTQAGPQLVADRYAYLSTLPFFALVGGGTARLLATGTPAVTRLALGTAACLGLVLAAASVRQIGFWRDTVSLWSHAVRVVPDSAPARYYLGRALQAEGRAREAETEYRAIDDIAASRSVDHVASSYRGLALAQRGAMASEAGDHRRALEQLALASRLAPRDVGVKLLHGHALLRAGAAKEAVSRWEEAAAGQRDEATLRAIMALDLLEAGAVEEAERMLRVAERVAPREPRIATLLGVALLRQGRRAEAEAAWRRALELDPGHAEAARLLAEAAGTG